MKSLSKNVIGVAALLAILVFMSAVYLSKRERILVHQPKSEAMADHRKAMAEVLQKHEDLWSDALKYQVKQYMPWREITSLGVKSVHVLLLNQSDTKSDRVRWADEIGDQSIVIPRDRVHSNGEYFRTDEKIDCYLMSERSGLYVLELDVRNLEPTLRKLLDDALLKSNIPYGIEQVHWITGNSQDQGLYQERWNMPSRLGDWSLGYRYASERQLYHHTPTLFGGAAFAGVLLLLGVVTAWHYHQIQTRAAQQTSFVNRASHELRTPLTNLLLHSDLAKDSLEICQYEQVAVHITHMQEETKRLARMADNILTFARHAHGVTNRAQVDSAEPVSVAKEVFVNFEELWKRKKITFEFIAPVALPIYHNRDALQQILGNLCSNVEKYAGSGSHVVLEVSEHQAMLCLKVSDNGPMIPVEMMDRIFLPFERLNNSLIEAVSGAGLGLAISRELAEQCGGSLTLEQSDGIKSFQLLLPYSV